jgi:photosystem II stability/assembly factor-like uncharacterized protein
LIAAGFGNAPDEGIAPFASTDFGVTWTKTSVPFTNCWSVTSSADGQQLAAATYEETIYISTNTGSSWHMAGPPAGGSCVRLSGDGRVLVVVGYCRPIYVSTNLGATWTTTPVPINTSSGGCATSSADGSKWVLGGQNYTYTSTNYGTTWDRYDAFGTITSMASSTDGSKLFGVNNGNIYTSFITSPLLSISNSGNALLLSWPPHIGGFALQATPNLALTSWVDVEATPSFSNGHYQVILSPTNGQSFLRLRHP